MTAREEHDQAERDFVTNAAHELQSPLAAITSAVEVLQAGAKDGADRDRFLGHIEREAHRLNRLTRALLTLARAQIQVEQPRTEMIELCPMLEAIADRAEPTEGTVLTVECSDDVVLVSNRELLEQAISNVVRNSVKYTEEGTIRLVAHARDRDVAIEVVGTGTGIPAESLPRVTERFYRADPTPRGAGLGLAIVAASVQALGGELDIASTLGYGTTVTITLQGGATRVSR